MKRFLAKTSILSALILGLAACAQEPEVPFTRVTEEILLTQIVDRKMTVAGDTFTINSDGTLVGTFNGGITGTWQWVDGFWCREIPTLERKPSDCQLMEIAGNQVKSTRDKGEGRVFVATIEG
jgi:hypothetical protein